MTAANATVRFEGDIEVTLADWHFEELHGGLMQIGGWLTSYERGVTPAAGPIRLLSADLSGRSCQVGQDVDIEVKGYGGGGYGTGLFMKIQWEASEGGDVR